MNPSYDQVHAACQRGDLEALQQMFPDGPTNPIVSAACRRGDLEVLRQLFPDGPTEWRSLGGVSVLHVVVDTPHLPVLDWLLTFPLDVNGLTDYGHTPLMWACYSRQEVMVRGLLDHGADLQATDPKGWTALHMVCSREWVDGVAWLLERGADPDVRDRQERLPEEYWSVSSPQNATLCALLGDARQGCGLK
jgi:ankyrin repeat protein